MASQQDHINQWKHNRAFLAKIPSAFPDWQVTAVFYTALHAVDALLAFDNVNGVCSHTTRNRVLMDTNKYLGIYKAYIPLYGLARTVRYLADRQQWIKPDKVDKEVVRRYLLPVEQSVQKLMKQELQLGDVKIQ